MGRFYMHKPLNRKDYSSKKILGSILLGLATMIIFYLFQQYFFVLIRSVFLGFRFNANHILSEDLGNLAVLIFAGNAVILGNSVGISFFISGVSKTAIKRFRKLSVLNNQSFLIGTYYYLFVKVVVFMGMLLMLLSNTINIVNAWNIYILLFVVLFLESVKELRRSFRGYSIRALLLHFLLVVGLVFTCALINKQNYYKLGNIYNTSNPYVNIPKVNIDIPDNIYDYDVYNELPIFSYNRYERVPVKVLSSTGKLIYTIHGESLSIDKLLNAPYNEKYNYSIRYGDIADLYLYANDDVAYEHFKELEEKAIMKRIDRIQYVLYSNNANREFIYSKYLYPTKEMLEDSITPLPVRFMYFEKTFKNKKEIPVILDTFKIKNQIDTNKVYTYFQKSVSDSVFFNLKINKEITLQQYLDFMITYKQSVYDLRDEQNLLNNELQDYTIEARKKYPFYYTEDIE